MIKKHLKFFFATFLFIITVCTNSFAGTTGKISGKIIDSSNGEPLIGANVIIMGTTLGAATDFDGNYFIINIPPGRYEVKASSIGYNAIVMQNVKVSVDQTTKLNFELQEEAVEMGDVVVTATRPIVQKDLTSTQSNISGEDILMLPLETVQSVVNLQAGVINGHFRGGRLAEVQYLVDGVSTNDAFSGLTSLEPNVNSIQEVQVLTGTFNAEYGDALSGVVNQITKIPGDNYDFNFKGYFGDYVSSRTDLYDNIGNISPTGVYDLQGTFSGPIPGAGELLKFFISGRYFRDEGYIYGERIFNPSDVSDFSANDPAEWQVVSTGDGIFVPIAFDNKLSLQAKIAIKVGTGRGIILNGLYSNRKYRSFNDLGKVGSISSGTANDHIYMLNPDGDYTRLNDSYLLSAQYTHVFSNSTFLDLLASAFESDFSQYVFEDPLDPRYVDPNVKNAVSGNAFLTGGTQNWHFNHTSTNIYW